MIKSKYKAVTEIKGKKRVKRLKPKNPKLIPSNVMESLHEFDVINKLSNDPVVAKIASILITALAEKGGFKKGIGLEVHNHIEKSLRDKELPDSGGSKTLEELLDFPGEREIKYFKKNELIYQSGKTPVGLYFISKGKVKTFIINEEGNEYIVDFYNNGDFLGYIPLLSNTAFPDSALALEDTEISLIPKNEFLSLIFSNTAISGKFMQLLAKDIEEQEELMVKLAYDSIRMRVADTLYHLRDKFKDKEGSYREINLSRENLAKKVGTTTESLIRTLTQFKNEKLIEVNMFGIKILNPEKLVELKN